VIRRIAVLTPEVRELLALAMFPDPQRIAAALERYASDPQWQVWVWETNGRSVCAVGVKVSGAVAEVLHIGTGPRGRGQGAGRALLSGLMTELSLERLEAETDDEAVGFYRRTGFSAEQTEHRGGHVRYRCVLKA
jgi:ribosomal protein S18 acetylase RimI-like enzyme